MNILSRYAFISSFNAEKITRQQSEENGIISIDEILANQEVCDKNMQAIQAKIDKISNEEFALKAQEGKEAQEPKKFELAA